MYCDIVIFVLMLINNIYIIKSKLELCWSVNIQFHGMSLIVYVMMMSLNANFALMIKWLYQMTKMIWCIFLCIFCTKLFCWLCLISYAWLTCWNSEKRVFLILKTSSQHTIHYTINPIAQNSSIMCNLLPAKRIIQIWEPVILPISVISEITQNR